MEERKLVVVSGATKGVGLAVSRRLSAAGYDVVGIARSITPEFSDLQTGAQTKVSFLEHDLSRLDRIYSLAKELQATCGRVYGLVNNAAAGMDGVLTTMHERDIAQVLDLNLHSPILLSKYLCRGMLVNRSGRIVNISSIVARTGFNGLSVYGAAKAGLEGFTKSLARELGRARVTVNAVAPGFLETSMTSTLEGSSLESVLRRSPLSRFATPEEVASAVVYLLSDQAAGITGTVITVDAGSTA